MIFNQMYCKFNPTLRTAQLSIFSPYALQFPFLDLSFPYPHITTQYRANHAPIYSKATHPLPQKFRFTRTHPPLKMTHLKFILEPQSSYDLHLDHQSRKDLPKRQPGFTPALFNLFFSGLLLFVLFSFSYSDFFSHDVSEFFLPSCAKTPHPAS